MCSYCWGQYDPREFEGHALPNSNAAHTPAHPEGAQS